MTNNEEHEIRIETPFPPIVGITAAASFITLTAEYLVARRLVGLLNGWWLQLLIYLLIPASLTFVCLFRSSWQAERTGMARAAWSLLVAALILVVVLAILAFVLGLASLSLDSISARAGGR